MTLMLFWQKRGHKFYLSFSTHLKEVPRWIYSRGFILNKTFLWVHIKFQKICFNIFSGLSNQWILETFWFKYASKLFNIHVIDFTPFQSSLYQIWMTFKGHKGWTDIFFVCCMSKVIKQKCLFYFHEIFTRTVQSISRGRDSV